MPTQTFRTTFGPRELAVELTPLAAQSNGRALVRYGETVVLVTAVMSKTLREGVDFFPLTVEYEEKFSAAGKILGSRFIRRESRPSEEAILTDRLIDRTIRPRFDLRMRNEVQVVATVLALDEENDPDIPSLLGASLALSLSDIPWDGPVAGVRIGRSPAGEWLVNPSFAEREALELELVASGTAEKINMIEAGCREVPEEAIVQALELGEREIRRLVAFEREIIAAVNPAKIPVTQIEPAQGLAEKLRGEFVERLASALWEREKTSRNRKLASLREEWRTSAAAASPASPAAEIEHLWEETLDGIVHRRIIESGERPDGRRPEELRPIEASAGALPRVHGSGLFIRGETQALSTLTLGGPGDELIIEGMEVRTKRRFIYHYNFPPYSTGEVKPMRGPGRREIGHGALAGRALTPLIPSREEFPYTIRIVSEILSSNGSSSMASVCASSLALFDAGVPLKKAAAGIAMGLMMEQKSDVGDQKSAYVILTDIQGPEDYYGDMDFKAAGTREGITALQMDVKIEGVSVGLLVETLAQARAARLQILEVMARALPQPRAELSPYAPRITIIKIDPEKIGALIGPGGKMINSIIAATGVDIDVEDDGSVYVLAQRPEAMAQAVSLIKQVTREFMPGDLLEGTVSRLFDFGAMVEVGPKQEGLVHISELAPWHVERVEDIVKLGDRIPVVVREIDEQGRLNLSLKDVADRYTPEERARGERERELRGASARPPGRFAGARSGERPGFSRSRRPAYGRGAPRGRPFGRRAD